ncbi:hypothetical protein BJ322DRAFT_1112396 [Thelephora terrestris]|uniref:DUF6533 domain-containing protein n=1 Tax=Thelephora terrestris TaxID=56493 RepID=A0A9P6H801_9AGAM|nr:hypothetical protein BJ322DRAFT_1112396 [Thelephora terrestris]
MSSHLDDLIQLGHDITSTKYYALATGTILFYDYLLTLADEIEFVWSGKKSWMFCLFVAKLQNRYFPMAWQFWWAAMSYGPQSEHYAKVSLVQLDSACNKTAVYTVPMFVFCTILAQVVLTVRIYAVTLKNIPITIGLVIVTICQLVPGLWITILSAREGGQPLPPIPLDAYHVCVPREHPNLGVMYTSISLLYDFLAFSLIMFFVTRSKSRGLGFRTIWETVAEDATWYFLVIFTAHLVFVFTLNLAPQTIKLLPAVGIVVYLPVMISRIILSLRRAACLDTGKNLSFGELSMTYPNMTFYHPQSTMDEGEVGIPLDAFFEA